MGRRNMASIDDFASALGDTWPALTGSVCSVITDVVGVCTESVGTESAGRLSTAGVACDVVTVAAAAAEHSAAWRYS